LGLLHTLITTIDDDQGAKNFPFKLAQSIAIQELHFETWNNWFTLNTKNVEDIEFQIFYEFKK